MMIVVLIPLAYVSTGIICLLNLCEFSYIHSAGIVTKQERGHTDKKTKMDKSSLIKVTVIDFKAECCTC